jgi:hypothetical protein
MWRFSIIAASALIDSALPASVTWASTRSPIAAAVLSTPSLFLSAQITAAPSAANASAEALPMPEAAPRTSAVLPSRRNIVR